MVGEPSTLRILLDLFIAVTLVGALITILMASNYYIRKNSVNSRRGNKWHPRHRSEASDDPVMQYEHMTREEIKKMVLREKGPKAQNSGSGGGSSDSEPLVNLAEAEAVGTEPVESEPRQVIAGAPETDAKAPASAEAVLLAELAMKEDEPEKKSPTSQKQPPKGHKSDGVIRGALSNEMPEEYKGKSRRI